MKNSIYTRFQKHMMRLGNLKTRRILLQLDDRTLEDAGISRDLLEQGIHTWPWRIEAVTNAPLELVEQTDAQRNLDVSAAGDDFQHAA